MDAVAARTTDQNAKFHAMCRDISRQVVWAGFKWSEEDWKRIFLGAKFEQGVVENPFTHGVTVVNKKRSRELSIEQMAELIGEIEAFGIQQGVDWTEDEDDAR